VAAHQGPTGRIAGPEGRHGPRAENLLIRRSLESGAIVRSSAQFFKDVLAAITCRLDRGCSGAETSRFFVALIPKVAEGRWQLAFRRYAGITTRTIDGLVMVKSRNPLLGQGTSRSGRAVDLPNFNDYCKIAT
jgi:hypothetical protein